MTMSRQLASIAIVLGAVLSGCGGTSSAPTPTTPGPSVCPKAPAGDFTLNSGETLRMSFSVPPMPTVDVMFTDFGNSQASTPAGSASSWVLFNGTTVLGTLQNANILSFGIWRSASSLFTGPFGPSTGPFASQPATTIDFTSVAAGSIVGRAELTVTGGAAIHYLDLSGANVTLYHGTSGGALSSILVTIAPTSFALISTSCH